MKKITKAIKQLKKGVFFRLPKKIRHKIIRNNINLTYELPTALSFKIAETDSEFEQAFQLTYKCYLKAGITKPQNSKLRVTQYQAIPSTTLLVAKWNQKVVGTVSIIKDSALGLPIDEIFDLEDLRKENKKLGEISSLAIDPNFINRNKHITLPLMKFLYEISRDYLGIDVLTIATNSMHSDFYEAIFGYRKINRKMIKNYDFANGKEAVGRYSIINHEQNKNYAINHYKRSKDQNNILKYYFEYNNKNAIFPKRNYFSTNFTKLTKNQVNNFFEKTNIFSQLSKFDLLAIYNYYKESDLESTISQLPLIDCNKLNRNLRFDVDFRGSMSIDDLIMKTVVQSACEEGCQIWTPKTLKKGAQVFIRVEIAQNKFAKLRGEICWATTNKAGVKLSKSSPEWLECISYKMEIRNATQVNQHKKA